VRVNRKEVKTYFSKPLARIALEEEVVIAEAEKLVAKRLQRSTS